jgi:4-hydroxy-3-methylbut-2-enyl diphosphate reductase IspH
MTSIIHGKASHEETRATASHAVLGGKGHYLIVLTLADTSGAAAMQNVARSFSPASKAR